MPLRLFVVLSFGALLFTHATPSSAKGRARAKARKELRRNTARQAGQRVKTERTRRATKGRVNLALTSSPRANSARKDNYNYYLSKQSGGTQRLSLKGMTTLQRSKIIHSLARDVVGQPSAIKVDATGLSRGEKSALVMALWHQPTKGDGVSVPVLKEIARMDVISKSSSSTGPVITGRTGALEVRLVAAGNGGAVAVVGQRLFKGKPVAQTNVVAAGHAARQALTWTATP